MGSITFNSLLQRAIPLACSDRESLADSFSAGAPEATEARKEAARFRALVGRRFKDMSADELGDAMLVYLYAQQWEESLADASPGRGVERKCRRNAHYFKTARHHLFGKTNLEVAIESASSVTIYPATEADIALLRKHARNLTANRPPEGSGGGE